EALGDLAVLLLQSLRRAPVRGAVPVGLLGRHAAGPDHPGRAGRRALYVTADAGRVLAVEDALCGHRPERPDQLRQLLGAPGAEALLFLARLVVAERGPAAADREPGRLGALHVDVRSCGMPGLMDRYCTRLLRHVVGADRRARLDGGHRLDDVGPAERHAAVVVRDRERHRADLLDHRRRVAVRDPRELVATPFRVEILVVRDLLQVEPEDVQTVALRGRPEPHVAAHAARSSQGRVEHLHGDVGRADEVDLVAGRARVGEPEFHATDSPPADAG